MSSTPLLCVAYNAHAVQVLFKHLLGGRISLRNISLKLEVRNKRVELDGVALSVINVNTPESGARCNVGAGVGGIKDGLSLVEEFDGGRVGNQH